MQKLARMQEVKKRAVLSNEGNMKMIEKWMEKGNSMSASGNLEFYLNNVVCFTLDQQNLVVSQIHESIKKDGGKYKGKLVKKVEYRKEEEEE